MPAGLQISSPAADRFTRLLGRYLEANARNAGELVARKAGSVSLQLYRLTAALAPGKSEIARDVKARGWQVKRKPGAWPLKKGEKRGSQGPLRRMQAAQIGAASVRAAVLRPAGARLRASSARVSASGSRTSSGRRVR